MRRFSPLLALLALGCQPDYDLGKVEGTETEGPAIELDPSELYFGTGEAGTELVQSFAINSVGTVALTVTDIQLGAEGPFSIAAFGDDMNIRTGASESIVVTYTATGEEDVGEVLVFSNDPESPHTVLLNGGGLSPELTIDPDSYDFGYVPAGSSAEAEFALRNTGDATLQVTSVGTTESVFAYALGDSLPIALEPGEETTVTVTYSPTDDTAFSGLLEVGSNDPFGLRVAELNGQGAVDQPIAVCEASPSTVEAINESTTWRGSASYDPSGARITDYDWRLTDVPAGSAATMPAGGANRSGFTPDVVGIYEAELVVTNEYGVESEPCTATLEALPGGDLWIEMYWVNSGDDMDLHLLKPGGSLESNGDCYYANCTFGGLDWGVSGDSSDNPSLDLDDISGVGPENINIDDPQNGTFTVYVHDFPGSVYNGNNNVTVNIYIGGVLTWTDTRNINTEDAYEPFAEISWPSETVTSL